MIFCFYWKTSDDVSKNSPYWPAKMTKMTEKKDAQPSITQNELIIRAKTQFQLIEQPKQSMISMILRDKHKWLTLNDAVQFDAKCI